RGLLHRAIVQSGGPNLVRLRQTSLSVARAFLKRLKVTRIDELRSIPIRRLLRVQARFLARNEFAGDAVFGPVVDTEVLPVPPLHAIEAGSARDIPLLVGTTLDEARLWSLYVPILRWVRPRALENVLRHAVGHRWREVIAAYVRSRPGERAGN